MNKWQSNLIIAGLVFFGLQLASEDINKFFYKEPVLPPTQLENTKKKSENINISNNTPVQENGVQIVTKNDTIKTDNVQKFTLEALNQMSASDLESINGIGPVLAKRIMEYRQKNGPFKSLDGLDQVSGIGPQKLKKIKEQFHKQ